MICLADLKAAILAVAAFFLAIPSTVRTNIIAVVAAVILLSGVAVIPAYTASHLPDCKKDPKCLFKTFGWPHFFKGMWDIFTAADMQTMINDGADVNATDYYGSTPLHLAAMYGKAEVISVLVQAGADINVTTIAHNGVDFDAGKTPLHKAAFHGNVEVIPVLVQLGADVNAGDNYAQTPLHEATLSGKIEAVPILVKEGADINVTDKFGRTPLHHAAIFESAEVIPVLVKAGAYLEPTDNKGFTPLHRAAEEGDINAVKALVRATADILATTDDGLTPLDLARKHKKWAVVKYLESVGKLL